MPYVASADLKRFDLFLLSSIHWYALPFRWSYVHMHIHLRLRICACLKHTVNSSPSQRYNVCNVFYIHTIRMICIKCTHCKWDNTSTVDVDILFIVYIYIHIQFSRYIDWFLVFFLGGLGASSQGNNGQCCKLRQRCGQLRVTSWMFLVLQLAYIFNGHVLTCFLCFLVVKLLRYSKSFHLWCFRKYQWPTVEDGTSRDEIISFTSQGWSC